MSASGTSATTGGGKKRRHTKKGGSKKRRHTKKKGSKKGVKKGGSTVSERSLIKTAKALGIISKRRK